MPQWLKVLYDADPAEASKGAKTEDAPADDPKDKKPEPDAEPAKTAEDVAKLKMALEKERLLREEAEKKLKQSAKAKADAEKSVEERLAAIESENRTLKLNNAINKAVDDAIEAVEKTHEVSRADVMERLEEMHPTDENYEAKVAKAVAWAKTLKKEPTDHETRTPRSDKPAAKIDLKNPPRIADVKW